jgi:hypothetical protein
MLHFGLSDLELFPKQDSLTGGPGSLIRLPFGMHRKSGKRYGFYLTDKQPLAPTLREQIRLFETPETVSIDMIQYFAQKVPIRHEPSPRVSRDKDVEVKSDVITPTFERIKQSLPVRDFVSRYVDLSANGTGLCPFHDDHVESFSIHEERNFWKCFACGKSGSIIDFWMHYQNLDFKTAVSQLESMLL